MQGFNVRDMRLRGYTLLLCRQHDGGTVRVISTDIKAVMAPRPLEPHPDVGLHLLQHVAQVQGSVGVGQRAGYQYFSRGVCSHSSKVSECIKTGRYYSGFDRRFHRYAEL